MATIKRKITISPKKTVEQKQATPKTAPAAAKPSTPAKPSVPHHNIVSGYTGVSDVTNTRASRTEVDYSKFGTMGDAKLTDRDRKAIEALRGEFGNRQFERANVDAGILRRLGERGFIAHVKGAPTDPLAVVKLTGKKLPEAKAA